MKKQVKRVVLAEGKLGTTARGAYVYKGNKMIYFNKAQCWLDPNKKGRLVWEVEE